MFNSIRFKLLFLAISGSALSVAIAGVAWLGVQNITSNSGELMVDLEGVQNHMQLDMMHDALRGDVLRAILDAQDGGHSRGDVLGAVKEHAAELRKMLDLNLKLALQEQVIAELQRAKAPLETYAHSAEEFVDLAYTDLSAARASMGKFQAAFEGLEGVNESITELMDTTTDAAQKADEAAFETTQRYVLLSVLVGAIAAFGLTIFGIYTANSIARPIAQATGVLEQLAAGDFTGQLGQQSITELSRMSAALDQAIIGISQALSDVNSSASQLAVASQQVSTSSAQMSDGAQQQASALEETAASLEEITGTIKQNADSARQASQLAQSSREIAERGGRVVGQAVDSIKEINRSSEKIANIITTIDEIAFQTNLLALNAAVEAARAGEQGRGFAVVASEVRNLAQRSASSAKEIKALIEESLQKVSAGSELVDKSGQSLQEIVASVKRVTEIIAEIAAASQEQATGVDQVNRAVTQMDQVVQGNAGQTSQLASTANALAQQATELQTLVGRFQLADGTHATQHYAPAQNFAPAAPAYTPAPPTLARAHSARRPAQHVTTEATVPAGGGGDEGFIEF